MFDVIIIGGGPGGYKVAELLGKRGYSVALCEEDEIGGTCLNYGCIPFKSLLYVAGVRNDVVLLEKAGLLEKRQETICQEKVIQNKNRIIKALQKSIENTLACYGVHIYRQHAKVVAVNGKSIIVNIDDETIEAAKLVIATGSTDKKIVIPNELNYKVLSSKDMLEMDCLPTSISIIGAGAVGLEAASYFADAGSDVTVIESAEYIGGDIDIEISGSLRRILERKGINIYTGMSLKCFEKEYIICQEGDTEKNIYSDCVLVAMGRIPRLDENSLKILDVEWDSNGIKVDERCQTTNSNVYACGDVTGKMMLAHVAYRQAKIIVDSISGKQENIDYTIVPRVIYTNPEVLSIGMTEKDCENKAIEFITKSLPMTYSGKYFAENGKDGAIAKAVFDKNYRLIGFHMIGNTASEISLAVELIIMKGMRMEEIQDLIFSHPSYGEILGELMR